MLARPGYTLLEVVLVLALLVILAGIAVPVFDAMQADAKVTAAADTVRGKWADARARAMEDGRAYQFAVMPGEDRFRLAPDLPDFATLTAESVPASEDGAPPPLIDEGSLPKGVKFQIDPNSTGAAVGEGGWTRIATFLADGTCQESSTSVTFAMPGVRPITLTLRGLTGSVTRRKAATPDQGVTP
jgi:prepilin-type N-terminal cleavage/methylation domain-containing protein